MPYESTNVAKLGSLQQLATAIVANNPDLAHIGPSCQQYIAMVNSLQAISMQQAALVASKQEASKQFKILLTDCQRLATVLRTAIKQHYGIRAEKLAEYNLQPFRGRKRLPKPEPTPAPPAPEAAAAS